MKSQKQMILEYLQRGYGLTPLIALDRFGCFRLSERIRELERDGHSIEHIPYHYGRKRCMSYKLVI